MRRLLRSPLKLPREDFRNWLRGEVAKWQAAVAAGITARTEAAEVLRGDIEDVRRRIEAKRNRIARAAEQELRRRQAESLSAAVQVMREAARKRPEAPPDLGPSLSKSIALIDKLGKLSGKLASVPQPKMAADQGDIEQHSGEYRVSLPPAVERYAACEPVDRSELKYLTWKLENLLRQYKQVTTTLAKDTQRYADSRAKSRQALDAQRVIRDRSSRQLQAKGITIPPTTDQ
jgi:septal ring factor EnvC (AmiA/AmiB activator)